MLFHGIAKIRNPGSLDYIEGMVTGIGLPPEIVYGVYIGEIVAPLMLIFGVYARVGGLILLGNMLFAVALVHTGDFLSLTKHGGWALELQAFYLFGGLAIILLGSGRIAVRPD